MIGESGRSTRSSSGGLGVCTPTIHHLHNSGHQPGRINQTSEIDCAQPVYWMEVKTQLQKKRCFWFVCSWRNYGKEGKEAKYNTDFVEAHSNHTCSDGAFRGRAKNYIRFTPSSPVQAAYGIGVPVSIRC